MSSVENILSGKKGGKTKPEFLESLSAIPTTSGASKINLKKIKSGQFSARIN
jgi:hypothetical protein